MGELRPGMKARQQRPSEYRKEKVFSWTLLQLPVDSAYVELCAMRVKTERAEGALELRFQHTLAAGYCSVQGVCMYRTTVAQHQLQSRAAGAQRVRAERPVLADSGLPLASRVASHLTRGRCPKRDGSHARMSTNNQHVNAGERRKRRQVALSGPLPGLAEPVSPGRGGDEPFAWARRGIGR